MDFIRSTSEKMNLWPVEHFFPPVFFPDQCWLVEVLFLQKNPLQDLLSSVISTNQHWFGKKWGKKVFNWSEVHFFGSISYEIHILVFFWTFQGMFLNEFFHMQFFDANCCRLVVSISPMPHVNKVGNNTRQYNLLEPVFTIIVLYIILDMWCFGRDFEKSKINICYVEKILQST